ncbi:MFS transporter [Edaphobacter sp. 12200R-103]|jgi:ACS family hexuronate transporter-like MFS transporter|uniref:MFS transporter n=1 Tax=Edaphobacter sp. 12200R-103 TaxID=2703788 RepID=UPI00138B61BA|nr:MFS transporter [Edaphobacter sp. 12200R-103]QHS50588.1 MFS transporter [Edaphobacter sp. 12200R-103]
MSTNPTTSPATQDFTLSAPDKSNVRWFVCFLLFLATTINYMDRSVFSLIEPLLHLDFMGWVPGVDAAHQTVYNINYGRILICFQIAYGVGFLFAGRIIDKLGTKTGYAIAILVWGCASISHSLVGSVAGFCIARIFLGLGESGNFPAAIKATTEWFPSEERALATGLFNSGSNASAFVAPVLIAAVTMRWGWNAAFITTGSMGLIWCVIWLLFPYNRLRRGATQTQANLAPVTQGKPIYSVLLRHRGFWAFCIGKGFTDPIWWFYLFYLPKFLNDNYGLDLNHVKYPLIVIYTVASIGSVAGGWLSGFRMKHGHSVNSGRKFALLVCALCVLPIMLVPHMKTISPNNAWPAIALFCLATAAHQGWSANLFSTPTDMFPSTSVSTVVGIGGTAGAIGGAIFTWVVSHYFALHPLPIFALAGFAYVSALAIFQVLVPRLGQPRTA